MERGHGEVRGGEGEGMKARGCPAGLSACRGRGHGNGGSARSQGAVDGIDEGASSGGWGRGSRGAGCGGRRRRTGARWRGRDWRKETARRGGWSGGTVRLVDALAPALRCSRDYLAALFDHLRNWVPVSAQAVGLISFLNIITHL